MRKLIRKQILKEFKRMGDFDISNIFDEETDLIATPLEESSIDIWCLGHTSNPSSQGYTTLFFLSKDLMYGFILDPKWATKIGHDYFVPSLANLSWNLSPKSAHKAGMQKAILDYFKDQNVDVIRIHDHESGEAMPHGNRAFIKFSPEPEIIELRY